jgi:hypothetical protein
MTAFLPYHHTCGPSGLLRRETNPGEILLKEVDDSHSSRLPRHVQGVDVRFSILGTGVKLLEFGAGARQFLSQVNACIFHGCLPPSPREACHVDHGKVATHARRSLPGSERSDAGR